MNAIFSYFNMKKYKCQLIRTYQTGNQFAFQTMIILKKEAILLR